MSIDDEVDDKDQDVGAVDDDDDVGDDADDEHDVDDDQDVGVGPSH